MSYNGGIMGTPTTTGGGGGNSYPSVPASPVPPVAFPMPSPFTFQGSSPSIQPVGGPPVPIAPPPFAAISNTISDFGYGGNPMPSSSSFGALVNQPPASGMAAPLSVPGMFQVLPGTTPSAPSQGTHVTLHPSAVSTSTIVPGQMTGPPPSMASVGGFLLRPGSAAAVPARPFAPSQPWFIGNTIPAAQMVPPRGLSTPISSDQWRSVVSF